jgi:hypothetical protein
MGSDVPYLIIHIYLFQDWKTPGETLFQSLIPCTFLLRFFVLPTDWLLKAYLTILTDWLWKCDLGSSFVLDKVERNTEQLSSNHGSRSLCSSCSLFCNRNSSLPVCGLLFLLIVTTNPDEVGVWGLG